MWKASNYNIYVPLENEEEEYLLVHGYTGAMDVVSKDIYDRIVKAENNPQYLLSLPNEDLETLKLRNYITEKSREEETFIFKKITNLMKSSMKKGKKAFTLIPTYNCNFRCVYCFERSIQHDKNSDILEKVMDKSMVDTIFHAIDQLKEDGTEVAKRITLYGGEPLMHKNYEIVQYIFHKGWERNHKYDVITNGYSLDMFLDLLDPEKMDTIQITLDGSEAYHDKRRFLYTGGPTFSKIIENISLALEKGLGISVRTNVDDKNIDQLEYLMDLYEKKGWNKFDNFSYYFKAVHPCYIKGENKVYDTSIAKKLSLKSGHNRNQNLVSPYSGLNRSLKSALTEGQATLLHCIFCRAPIDGSTIDPFGDIYPCWEVVGDKNNSIGCIQDGKFAFKEEATYWRNRTVASIDECSTCPYALFCGGGCPAHAKVYNGSIYSPSCDNFIEIFHEVVPKVYAQYLEENKLKEASSQPVVV